MNTVSGGLKQLHELHVQHKAVSEVLTRGPRQVEARKRNAAKKLDEIERLRLQLTQTRKLGDEKALQLKVNEQRILDQQAKLNAASTNREFDIIRSQIDADQMSNSVLEDEILEVLERVDAIQKKIELVEQEHAQALQDQASFEKQVQVQAPELNEKIARIDAEIAEAEKILPVAIRADYRRLVAAKGGAGALAPVVSNSCGVCHTMLRPQLVVELNVGKFHFCSSCGRVLYRADDAPED